MLTRVDARTWRFADPGNITTYIQPSVVYPDAPGTEEILARWEEIKDYFNERAGGRVVLNHMPGSWEGATNALALGYNTFPSSSWAYYKTPTATIEVATADLPHLF
jgi:hypothetical protein